MCVQKYSICHRLLKSQNHRWRSNLHLVCVVIWGSYFHSGGEVEDDPVNAFVGLSPSSLDSFTDLQREVDLGLRECLWTVFVTKLGPICGGVLIYQVTNDLRVSHREVYGLLLGVVKDNSAK